MIATPRLLTFSGDSFWFTDDEPLPDASHVAMAFDGADRHRHFIATMLANRSGAWRAVELAHVQANPTCIACGSRKFLQVHHRLPFHLFPERELDSRNLRTLCMQPGHLCHFIVGHRFNWRGYSIHVDEDAALCLKRIAELKFEGLK